MIHKISIIIIVKNDRGIANTLDAIATQEKPIATEVLVIDASHPDGLKDIREVHTEVIWHQFSPKIPNKSSIPEQRNYGIRHADGDIIVFIDANCVPVAGWLKKLTAPIINGEENITAGPFGDVNTSSRVITEESKPHEYLTCSGTGNLAFKRSVWEKVQGFDENFLYGSDIDFTWRCVDAGFKIRSVTDAGVSHDWGTMDEYFRRSFKYGKARADLLIKHPHRVRVQLMGEGKFIVVYTIWLLGLPLTFFWRWYPLTIVVLILKNILHSPFKTVINNLTYTLGFYYELFRRFLK